MIITSRYDSVMSEKTPFSAALKYYRKKEKNLSQSRLAKSLGLTQAAISKIEKGGGGVSNVVRKKILDYFNKSDSEFLSKGEEVLGLFFQKKTTSKQLVVFKSKIEQEHFDIIRTFEDPETALSFNSFLSKLEKLDVAKYEEIYGLVRGIVRQREKEKVQEKKEEIADKSDSLGGDNFPRTGSG